MHVHDDQRHFGHHGESDELRLEGETRTGRDGARGLAGVRRADREADRGDLVLCLVHDAADPLDDPGHVVRGRGGRRDRVHRDDLDARRHDAEADGLVGRCILHEHDHLDGVLFIDRVSPAKKQSLKRRLHDLEAEFEDSKSGSYA